MSLKDYIYQELGDIYPPEELKVLAVIIGRDLLELSEGDCYVGKYSNLSPVKKTILQNIIARLRQFEPVQYIQGSVYFYRYPFSVAQGVLIPRPETEELVALIIRESQANVHILDIGTGSGCIAITLAKEIPGAVVQGWDISEQALTIARKNSIDLLANVTFRQTDILNNVPGDDTFDILVSNPPYVTVKEKTRMQKNVLDWEPHTSLFVPDDDPLLFYRRIAASGRQLLRKGGRLYFEINQYQGSETAKVLVDAGYNDIRLIKDMYGNHRILTAIL